ncbi:hypothetical protein [Chitinimonas sp. BJYL2]|uniref:hypothetical protein n=1 Tax=Chitinimonas sp. BJYL2 TaxID=2976696 RepID=UPI0022B58339|nr:hypothetical protein [Chitinimonas sp. BJYL2]
MKLSPAPGSVLWLLKWDLIQLYNWFSQGEAKRLGTRWRWAYRAFWLLLIHSPALLIMLLPTPSRDPSEARVARDIAFTFLGGMLFLSMVFMAVYTSVSALAERKYTETVLTSPLPANTLGRWFIGSNALGTLVGMPLFVLPFVNVIALSGRPQALLVYASIAGYALLAACIGVAASFSLQRILGTARAKRYVGIIGMTLLISSGILISLGMKALQRAQFEPQLWHEFVAGTLRGHWLPSLAVLLAGILAWRLMAPIAARGVYASAQVQAPPRSAPKSTRARFSNSPVRALLTKEWRLMLRHPMLAMNLANPMMMLIFPLMHMIDGKGDWREAMNMTVAFSGGMVVMTAHSLCWAASAMDESPSLLWSSPMPREQWRRYQLLAGLIPTWLAMLPLLAIVAWVSPMKALGLAVISFAGAIAGGLLAQAFYRPVPRHERNMQYGMKAPQVMAMMAYGAVWGGLSTALNGFALGLTLLPIALGVPAWLLMRQEEREFLHD